MRQISGLLIVLCACAGDSGQPSDGIQVVVDTTDGVARVANSGPPPAWDLVRIARIGAVEDGPAAFGRIRSVVADADGNVYVADNLANEVRVFDDSGGHRYTLGRQGGGPGEFGNLYSLAWMDDDKLAAFDPGNARISVFGPDRSLSSTIRHYPISGPPSLIRLHPVGVSGFYAPIISEERRNLSLVRFTSAGPTDTIVLPAAPEGARRYSVTCHRSDGGVTGLGMPDVPASAYAFPPAGGRIAAAWTEEYRIALLDSEGDTLQWITRQQNPIAYPDSLWDRAVEPYRELMANFPGSRCEPSAPQRPPARAALRHIVFDERGRMWVEAATDSGFAWDIYDSDGRQLARAPAPGRSTGVPPYVRSDRLYQVETDELGTQYVAIYRTVPSAQQQDR